MAKDGMSKDGRKMSPTHVTLKVGVSHSSWNGSSAHVTDFPPPWGPLGYLRKIYREISWNFHNWVGKIQVFIREFKRVIGHSIFVMGRF